MISIRHESGFVHRIDIGPHQLRCDMPTAQGSSESAAPDPHDFFDTALGACKALTLALYAQQKGLPLEHVDVDVQRDTQQERQGTYRLDVSLTLHGPLDEAQRQTLLRIADKCPIHNLMTKADIQINTQLATVEA